MLVHNPADILPLSGGVVANEDAEDDQEKGEGSQPFLEIRDIRDIAVVDRNKASYSQAVTYLAGYISKKLGLETGQAQPNTWIHLKQMKNKNITIPNSELCEQIRLMDILFDEFHGSGYNLRFGSNVMAATENFILSKETTKQILPRVINLFVKIKVHDRLKVLKHQHGEKSNMRNFTKTAHFQF